MKQTALGLTSAALGIGLIKQQLDNGNLTGRELVYHNTNKKNVDSIRDKGILKSKSYDKDNITHQGLKGIVKVKDMQGLTYMGRRKYPAIGVGVMSALNESKKEDGSLVKSLKGRKTLKAKIPSWKMNIAENPELMKTKGGKEFAPIIKKRYPVDLPDKLTEPGYRVAASLIHGNLGPKGTHTLRDSVAPKYIRGSKKYTKADKEEVSEFIKSNLERFIKGVIGTGVGLSATALGLSKATKGIRKVASVNHIAQGALGALLLSKSPDLLLGKKTLYQGTSRENWENIKREGLKSSQGGTGASKAVGNSAYQYNSRNKIHLTAVKPIANIYASVNTKDINDKKHEIARLKDRAFNIKIKEGEPGKSEVDYKLRRGHHKNKVDKVRQMESELRSLNMAQRNNPINTLISPSLLTDGKTVKIKMDYNRWKNDMQQDREGVMFKHKVNKLPGSNNPIIKNMAARGTIDVPIEDIVGSNSKLSEKAKNTLQALPSYARENPMRLIGGLASAGIGSKLIVNAIKGVK